MIKLKTFLLAAAAPAVAFASPAAAQTQGNVGVIDPLAAMFGATAIAPAWRAIGEQYRAAFTTAQQREQTLETQVAPLRKRLDTNNDGQVDQAELQAAQTANKPELQQIVTAQETAQRDIATALRPAHLAQAWVIDQLRQRYRPALNTVVTNKRLSVVMLANDVAFVAPANNVTTDVTAAINAAAPTFTTTPAANWQPDEQTGQLWQQFSQLLAASAQQRAQQAGAAGAPAARPAAGAPAAATPTTAPAAQPRRDRNGDPIRQ